MGRYVCGEGGGGGGGGMVNRWKLQRSLIVQRAGIIQVVDKVSEAHRHSHVRHDAATKDEERTDKSKEGISEEV